MKRLFIIAALVLAVTTANAQTGVQSVLNQLLGQGATSSTVTSIIENVVGSAVSKLNLSIDGTWKYSAPEVQFKSENLLAQAGGAAATTKIENNGGYARIFEDTRRIPRFSRKNPKIRRLNTNNLKICRFLKTFFIKLLHLLLISAKI